MVGTTLLVLAITMMESIRECGWNLEIFNCSLYSGCAPNWKSDQLMGTDNVFVASSFQYSNISTLL